MASRRKANNESEYADFHFPRAGIDNSKGASHQPTRPLADGTYARTCSDSQNVRTFDPLTRRMRGGSRPGLQKWINATVAGATWVVQGLDILVGTFAVPGGTVPQPSNSGRVVLVIAVSQGYVYTAVPGATAWTQATNVTGETPPLNYSGLVYSASNQQKQFFVDGTNYCYFDPGSNELRTWTATSGTLPADSENNKARLICTWRGRTVLSGLLKDSQNWFMSAISDPFNFNYSPESQSPDQAIAGNSAPQGLIGDPVTCLIPYSDDVLILGCDGSIYLFRGDPLDGGQIDLVTTGVGMAWGAPWCRDPFGTVYFFSNMTGIYSFVPGQKPIKISSPIDSIIVGINTGTHGIRMAWDNRYNGMHVFVTTLTTASSDQHYFWEKESGAWQKDVFGNNNLNPLCCVELDGNLPTDRVTLIGCWDGYVRQYNPDATTDDGTAISSYVIIGPILTPYLDEMMLYDMQGVLAANSGAVTWGVQVADTAEVASTASAVATGTWNAGRSLNEEVRRSGHAIYVKLSSTVRWGFESLRARIGPLGRVRMRG